MSTHLIPHLIIWCTTTTYHLYLDLDLIYDIISGGWANHALCNIAKAQGLV